MQEGVDERAAETYLRRRAEDHLADDDWDLPRRARTLLDVGVLSPGTYASLLGEWTDARALRGHDDDADPVGDDDTVEVRAAHPLELEWGTLVVDWIATSATGTSVSMSAVRSGPASAAGWPPHGAIHDGTQRRWFSWGSGPDDDDHWHCRASTEPALDLSAPLTLAGRELHLVNDPDDITAVTTLHDLTTMAAPERSSRYLEHLRAVADPQRHGHDLAAATDALIACGGLDAARADDGSVVPNTVQPSYWTGRREPPGTSVPLGTTVRLAGRRITLLGLRPEAAGIEIDLIAVRTGPTAAAFDTLDADTVAVSGVDDLGTRYTGRVEPRAFTRLAAGALVLEPALTPTATRIELTLSTFRGSVTIAIPWPRP